MIPSPQVAAVLALAVYRLCRLAGWDDFPLAVRVRAWVTGETIRLEPLDDLHLRSWTIIHDLAWRHGDRLPGPSLHALQDLDREHGTRDQLSVPVYRRPVLAKLLSCPFCLGFWLSLAAYVGWLEEPSWTLYGLAPFALSAAVGLLAKNLDA